MKEVKIGSSIFQHYVGSEGQDVYVAKTIQDGKQFLGKHLSDEDFDLLIQKDTDVYLPPDCDVTKSVSCDKNCLNCVDESNIALKFRKNHFTPEEQAGAYDALKDAATISNNRGLAAGPRADKNVKRDWVTPYQVDILEFYANGGEKNILGESTLDLIRKKHETEQYETRGWVWVRGKVAKKFDSYEGFFDKAEKRLAEMTVGDAEDLASYLLNDAISQTSYASPMNSGIAGFYDRYPRNPYGRPCSYNDGEKNMEKFSKCYPFARKLDRGFKELLPERYKLQEEFSDKLDPKFRIGEDTVFTTITVNMTSKDKYARMAAHRDAGSLNAGFSNLTVISKDGKEWSGGYLVCPEVRVAVDVRPGDLLLVDNMRVVHGNTEIEPPAGKTVEDMERMSLVFYCREGLAGAGSWDYECLRRQFVEDRKNNKEHPDWREGWNGVSHSMFYTQEWYDFLMSNGGEVMVKAEEPELFEKFNSVSLDSFF